METPKISEQEVKDGAPFAALSYLFFLWIFTFIFKKDNQFARFHAKQGIVISIAMTVCFLLSSMPLLGVLFRIIRLVLICASLYGIYIALTGKYKEIPLIGDIAKKLAV